jgi:serine/threonine protein kinase
MPRIDVWDAAPDAETAKLHCGFPPGLEDKYKFDRELGQGGFGVVRVVEEVSTGTKFACKSIKKSLDLPNISFASLQRHLDNIKREVAILRKLRGTVSFTSLHPSLSARECASRATLIAA